jgi:hypothetical protein
MFMCKECGQQYDDKDLAFTVILENRLTHPAAEMYLLKFCSKQHVQAFLEQINNQHQRYVLTKKGKGSDKQFEPAFPLDLQLLVGSTKAS